MAAISQAAYYTAVIISFVLLSLIGLLGWEYYMIQRELRIVLRLKDEYSGYVSMVKKLLDTGAITSQQPGGGEEIQENELEIDSLLVLNRSTAHLKQSTESYLKENDLDDLLDTIHPQTWNDYTQQVIERAHETPCEFHASSEKKHTRHKQVPFRKGAWQRKVIQRKPLTSIIFRLPIDKKLYWLSSGFGEVRRKSNGQRSFHKGIDMAAQRGTEVKSCSSGTVEIATYESGYGNTIVIKHDAVYKTRYAHLDVMLVQEGQQVQQGAIIGKVGDTGFTRKKGKDASHLHLEMYENGIPVNPYFLLSL